MSAFGCPDERTLGDFWTFGLVKLMSSSFTERPCLKARSRGGLRQIPDFNWRQSRISLLNMNQGKYSLCLRILSSLSQPLSTSGQDSPPPAPLPPPPPPFFGLLIVGSWTCSLVDESADFWTFSSAIQALLKIPSATILLLPVPPARLEWIKQNLIFLPTIPSAVRSSILVFSLSHSAGVFVEMKYVSNNWEGPYSWWITTLRNIVICNSLSALFAIYIYWKLIPPCISSFSMTDHW